MPDQTKTIQWADGTLHAPAGGHHKETDSTISELSTDTRLPQEANTAQKRLDVAATTAAKMMRAAYHAQNALNKVQLFNWDGITADKITSRDGVALQILKRLARAVEDLQNTPLDEDQGETELDRAAKVTAALSQMTKHQAMMEQSISKAVGLSTRASQEAAKLQHQINAHRDKMSLLKDKDVTAIDIERIADG